jgi:hypothetical protein
VGEDEVEPIGERERGELGGGKVVVGQLFAAIDHDAGTSGGFDDQFPRSGSIGPRPFRPRHRDPSVLRAESLQLFPPIGCGVPQPCRHSRWHEPGMGVEDHGIGSNLSCDTGEYFGERLRCGVEADGPARIESPIDDDRQAREVGEPGRQVEQGDASPGCGDRPDRAFFRRGGEERGTGQNNRDREKTGKESSRKAAAPMTWSLDGHGLQAGHDRFDTDPI